MEEKSSIGLYFGGVIRDEDGSSNLQIGPAIEYLRYSQPGARGLGVGLRATFAAGLAVGPSVFYVTRPSKHGVAFRFGATFPFGSNTIPFAPELGIGFRF